MRLLLSALISLLLTSCAAQSGYYTENGQRSHVSTLSSLLTYRGKPDISVKSPRGDTILVYKTRSYSTSTQPVPPTIGVHFSEGGKPVIITNANPGINTRKSMIADCLTIYTINPSGKVTSTQQQGLHCN